MWTYLFSISLQISGSLLMILPFVGKNALIKQLFPYDQVVNQDDNGIVTIKKQDLQATQKRLLLSIIAIINIILSISLSIYSAFPCDSLKNGRFIQLIIALITVIVLVEWSISVFLPKLFTRKDKNINIDELETTIGKRLATQITQRELNSIIKN